MFVGKSFTAIASLALICAPLVQASVVTVALGPIDASDGQSEGEIIGVGDEGTTFILSQPTRSDSANPGTLTMVQDASHVSIHLVATGDITEQIDVACGISGNIADCTEVLAEASGAISTAITFTTTNDAGFQTITVSTGSAPTDISQSTTAPASDATQASNTGSTGSSAAERSSVVTMIGGVVPFLLAFVFGA